MSKLMKTVIAILLVAIMCVGMFPITAQAAEQTFVTVKFNMVEGCTYPIYIELWNADTNDEYSQVLYHTNDYTYVFTVNPGTFYVMAMVDGDNISKYPIKTEPQYIVAEGSNLLVELAFSEDVANKAVEDSTPPEMPTVPSEPETEPTVPSTEPEKQPGEDKPEVPPVDNNPSKNPGETEKEPVETPFNWGPFIRAGIFVGIAGVVMVAMIIKKKRDEAALGGDDD